MVSCKATVLVPVNLVEKGEAWFARRFPRWGVRFDVPITADAKVVSEYWMSIYVTATNYAKLAANPGGVCDFGGVLYGGSMFGGTVAKCADPETILTKEGRARLAPTDLKLGQIAPKPAIEPKPRPTPIEEAPGKTEPGESAPKGLV